MSRPGSGASSDSSIERRMGSFGKSTALTLGTSVIGFLIALGTSVILARVLGPEARGEFALVFVLPALIANLTGLGIGPATTFHVARGKFRREDILGGSLLLAAGASVLGLAVGLVCVLFYRESIVPGVSGRHLAAGLAFIPLSRFFLVGRSILFGERRFLAYNGTALLSGVVSLLLLALVLLVFRQGVTAAVLVRLAGPAAAILALVMILARTGGVRFAANTAYLRKVVAYGGKVFLGNAIGFLNYRLDLLLLNAYLSPLTVGFYAIAVGLAERLWVLSQAASSVLFPTVAAEADTEKHSITPIVCRTVLLVTAIGAGVLLAICRWMIVLLYSDAYLPSVPALRILLVGIVALSVGRVLANDLAGRGKVMFNVYVGAAALVTNVSLNLLLIPRLHLLGAAWATAASYSLALALQLVFYCRETGESPLTILVPRPSDVRLFWRLMSIGASKLCRMLGGRLRRPT